MGRNATSIDEQLEILSQRGMVIDCKDKAKEYLLDIGYYRLGFYWHYFEMDPTHNFKPNTKIETIRELYYFDFDLKYLLSRYIYRIEVHFRTQLVYWASNKYKDSPAWFIDRKVVDDSLTAFIDNLYHGSKKTPSKFKIYNIPIKKHHKKYINDRFAPAWKTLEFFTFGQIIRVFNALKDSDLKMQIADIYGYKDLVAFKNHINAIVNIRNICSHNGILFDYNQPIGIKKIPNHAFKVKSRSQTNLNASISVIFSILSTISQNRTDDLKNQLNKLIAENLAIPELKEIIQDKIGYVVK